MRDIRKPSPGRTALLWRVWLLAASVVAIGSLLPGSSPPIQMISRFNDKLLHFLGYAVLGVLPALTADRRSVLLGFCAAALLGLGLEFGQLYVPGRSFDLMDWAADNLGVLCGIAVGLACMAGWRLLRWRRDSR